MDQIVSKAPTKQCVECSEYKPYNEFPKKRRMCKECKRLYDKIRYSDNKDSLRAQGRNNNIRQQKIKYRGDINEWYEEQLKRQGGKCAIEGCFEVPETQHHKRLDIDHNHQTGKLRGLLCRKCNIDVGTVENRLEAIQQYLAEYD
jgi:Autographiviridae endonuclease VII